MNAQTNLPPLTDLERAQLQASGNARMLKHAFRVFGDIDKALGIGDGSSTCPSATAEAVKKLVAERDRLQAALLEVRIWFEAERKSISKGNGSRWSMLQCQEQIDAIDAATAKDGNHKNNSGADA